MRLGIDLGGTKIEGAVLGPDGSICARRRVGTPRDSYDAILTTITELVLKLEADAGMSCSVGVGMPGIVSQHTGLVKNSNTVVLNGRPLDRDLEALLGRRLRFENDANCFALSEAVDGAGAGKHCVFGVIIGTGTGGALTFGRKIWRGANAIAGEWGHNPLPWPTRSEHTGARCYCGKTGCLETYLSGTGLARAYEEAGGGASASAEIITARYAAGDPAAATAIALYTDRLARGLASVINIVDPDIVVLGGGLSNIAALYDLIADALMRYAFSDHLKTLVVPAVHGDSGGVRGAAWLWGCDAR